jgi:hypothetical protein
MLSPTPSTDGLSSRPVTILSTSAVGSAPDLPPYAQHIKTYLNVLCLTRKTNFIHWTDVSVEKAFKWSIVVVQCCAQIERDYDQNDTLKRELDEVDITCCEFLPTVMTALQDPVQAMQRAILTSPLLSWCHNAEDIIKACLVTTHATVVPDLAFILQDSLMQQHRHKRAVLLLNTLMPPGESQTGTVDDFTVSSMAVMLLLALCSVAVIVECEPESENQPGMCREWELAVGVRALVADACQWTDQEDDAAPRSLLPLTILLHALLLSPGAIITSPIVIASSGGGGGGGGGSWGVEVEEEKLVALSNCPELWGVVEELARKDTAAFMSLFDTAATRSEATSSSVLTIERLLYASPPPLAQYITSTELF